MENKIRETPAYLKALKEWEQENPKLKHNERARNEIQREYSHQVREMNVKKLKVQREKGYLEVKNKFTQQNKIIRDSFNNRWVQCEICGEIKPDTEFIIYGGPDRINLGLCRKCNKKGE